MPCRVDQLMKERVAVLGCTVKTGSIWHLDTIEHLVIAGLICAVLDRGLGRPRRDDLFAGLDWFWLRFILNRVGRLNSQSFALLHVENRIVSDQYGWLLDQLIAVLYFPLTKLPINNGVAVLTLAHTPIKLTGLSV